MDELEELVANWVYHFLYLHIFNLYMVTIEEMFYLFKIGDILWHICFYLLKVPSPNKTEDIAAACTA